MNKVGLNLTLDWLAFTYKDESLMIGQDYFFDSFVYAFPELEELFQTMTICDHGRFHYKHAFSWSSGIRLQYDDVSERSKGLNVHIPSGCMQYFMDLLHVNSIRDLFVLLNDRGCVPSRLDLAFDDYEKIFKPEDYIEWWIVSSALRQSPERLSEFEGKPAIRSRFHHANLILSSCHGSTFYIGTRGKNRYLRIYDKYHETLRKQSKLARFGETCDVIDAIRYEFELHEKYCKQIFYEIIETNHINFVALLNDMLQVVTVSANDSNISRWNGYDKYTEWLESQLYCTVDIPILDVKDAILRNQSFIETNFPSIAKYIYRHGLDYFLNCVHECSLNNKSVSDFINYCESVDFYERSS